PRPAVGEVGEDRVARAAADGHEALLLALAEDAQEAEVHAQRGRVEAARLRDAGAGRVEDLDDRAVAEADRAGQTGRREEALDLLDGEEAGDALPELRRLDDCDA